MSISEEQVWEILKQVEDPEIPVISVVELGIIREVQVDGELVRVTMTPTFTGCPALEVMKDAIKSALEQTGVGQVEVSIQIHPPWSSEHITQEGRVKLKAFGLAPPPHHQGLIDLSMLDTAACPYCGSENTSLKNSFGPTLCRAIFYCHDCSQPFEQFKPI
jgi:ring-1,2-phenylacetyl-CoA epoxidase subunit PaaD